MQKNIIRLIQLILLIPSSLSVGLMALIAGIGAAPAFVASFLSNYQELGWGYGIVSLSGLIVYLVLFLVPAIALILLWVLIIKGVEWVAMRRKLALITIALGFISCIIVGWIIYGGPLSKDKDSIFAAALFLTPVIIGVINFVLLSIKVINLRNKT